MPVHLRRVHRLSPRRAAVWLAAGAATFLVAPAATAGDAAGAATTTRECRTVVSRIGEDLAAIRPAEGTKPTDAEERALRAKAGSIFAAAGKQHPACGNAIARYQAQLAASARRATTINGTPFWGPIGWAWNNVDYKVFSGNDIMMAMFGWALLLSPFILVFSLAWVLHGSRGAFHRPYVPPHLRTEP
jgi:hypothetical protein